MLGISRWTGDGGSYRTVQRFFATVMPWASLCWIFFRTHLFHPKVTATTSPEAGSKRKPGRPKGSATKAKTTVELTPELRRIQTMVRQLLHRIGGLFPLTYLVLDGHIGHNPALQMAQQCNLHLIAKLRTDTALYLPYAGPYAGRGPRRIYGDRIDPRAIPERWLRQTSVDDGVETRTYQLETRHTTFAQLLHVVGMVKTNVKTQAQAHGILFSSDLALPFDKLIDYYCLRFQLEFNFRDAKQYWGLEDFMNTRPTAVTNAANLSLFMVNLVERVLQDVRHRQPEVSVLDLKAHCRGAKYVEETIKMLPEPPEPVLVERIFTKIVGIGRIHAAPTNPILA
jgi:putative transposase